jgi:hypothetical protein
VFIFGVSDGYGDKPRLHGVAAGPLQIRPSKAMRVSGCSPEEPMGDQIIEQKMRELRVHHFGTWAPWSLFYEPPKISNFKVQFFFKIPGCRQLYSL